jgi:hypothetical protein
VLLGEAQWLRSHSLGPDALQLITSHYPQYMRNPPGKLGEEANPLQSLQFPLNQQGLVGEDTLVRGVELWVSEPGLKGRQHYRPVVHPDQGEKKKENRIKKKKKKTVSLLFSSFP